MPSTKPGHIAALALARVKDRIDRLSRECPNDHGGLAQLHMAAFTLALVRDDDGAADAEYLRALNLSYLPADVAADILVDAASARAAYEDELCADGRLAAVYTKATGELIKWHDA